jgi:hypothetical protein
MADDEITDAELVQIRVNQAAFSKLYLWYASSGQISGQAMTSTASLPSLTALLRSINCDVFS